MKNFLLVLSIVMVMTLFIDKADAENWIYWKCATQDKGSSRGAWDVIGAFDSYASCKAAEKSMCETIGYNCEPITGGICTKYKVSDEYGEHYNCWKCFPETFNPNKQP